MRNVLKQKQDHSFRYIISNIQDLKEQSLKFGFPFIIKPRKGIRSEWVRYIGSSDELNGYINSLKSSKIKAQDFLLEEFIQGHEVDVDIVLHNGDLMYAGVSDNFPTYKPFALETGHLMPSILNSHLTNMISDYAYKVALELGYRNGVLHIEAILKENGEVALIEVNGRVGGMYIPQWHKEVWKVDLIKSELAIAKGKNPKQFLHKKYDNKALAQLCINGSNGSKYNIKNLEIFDWSNFTDFNNNKMVLQANKWVALPYDNHIGINGLTNIGEIVVTDKTPFLAFQKLHSVVKQAEPILSTNAGFIKQDTNKI